MPLLGEKVVMIELFVQKQHIEQVEVLAYNDQFCRMLDLDNCLVGILYSSWQENYAIETMNQRSCSYSLAMYLEANNMRIRRMNIYSFENTDQPTRGTHL